MKWSEIKSTGEFWIRDEDYMYITKLTDSYIVVMTYDSVEDRFYTQMEILSDSLPLKHFIKDNLRKKELIPKLFETLEVITEYYD